MDDIPLGVLLTLLGGLLVLSAFFSMSETSMMAINRYRLKSLAHKGHLGARLTLGLLGNTDKLLGVILLGNNLVNAAVAALVTVIAVRLLGQSELAVSLATLAAAFALLVCSEITPKVIAANYPERIAIPASYLLSPLLKLALPAVWFVNLFVRGLLWLGRFKPAASLGGKLSMEELRAIVGEAGMFMPKKHHSILVNLFELEKTTVDDVMTPRNQIEAVDIDAPEDTLREQLATAYHTRLPVYRDELDNIVGIVHVRKVLHQMHTGSISGESLREILREPYFIPAGTPLLTQLQQFQENQRRLGLVVDEYGELRGLVTLEDILEEIVGEFTTVSPRQSDSFSPQEDGSWLVDGAVQLRTLNRRLGTRFPLDGPKTINGLILEHLEDIPESGTSLKIAGHALEIVQTQDRVVRIVRVCPGAEKSSQP